ncbi:hypothetical protein OEZ85_002573 [Tetradesmus obliquus]|uniref:VWFA domain-containing protein n=1 Tax=Tetradesmus obliquus TaxID=3088 RepID=A0ABY8U2V5_TETOB|nr:hypothetical protein OEZ85_002573 [Tetradesmus obliquus]
MCLWAPAVQAQRGTCGIAVCFSIDESGSIEQAGFDSSMNFTRSVINRIAALSQRSQYGAAEFGTVATRLQGLENMTRNVTAAIAAINGNKYNAGATNTDAGLAACYANTTSGVLTSNIDTTLPRMVMLLTDGNANRWDSHTLIGTTSATACSSTAQSCSAGVCQCSNTCTCEDRAAELRADRIMQAGITLVAIGVGTGINTAWLDKISDYNYAASDFNQLGTIIEQIVQAACTDVDVGVSCSANGVAVGGNGTVQLTLDNSSPYNVTGAIPLNITLPTDGLSLVGVTATAGAPPITCGSSATSGTNTVYICNVTTSASTPLRTNATLVYTLTTRALTVGNWTTTVVVKPPADNDATNNQAICTTRVTAPDVTVSKSPGNVGVAIGSNASYSITVNNVGGAAANNVVVTETLPAELVYVSGPPGCTASGATTVTCNITSIAAGGSTVLNITVRPTAAGPFTTSANVTAPGDSNAANNGPATNTITVVRTCGVYNGNGSAFACGAGTVPNTNNTQSTSPSNSTCCTAVFPDVTISKSPASLSVAIGSNASYNIVVSNVGGAAANNVVVTETLPAGLVYVSGPLGCAASGNTTVTCTIAGIIAAGGNSTLPIVVRPTAAGPFTTSATVTATGEQDTANNGPANTTITVVRTCAVYNGDGSAFACGANSVPNTNNTQSTNPSNATCCTALFPDVTISKPPTVSITIASNGTYTVTSTNPSNATCCTALFPDVTISKPPTVSIPIASNGTYTVTSTSPSNATCCTALFPDVTISKPPTVSIPIASNGTYTVTPEQCHLLFDAVP